jgi:hypothetical protein
MKKLASISQRPQSYTSPGAYLQASFHFVFDFQFNIHEDQMLPSTKVAPSPKPSPTIITLAKRNHEK